MTSSRSISVICTECKTAGYPEFSVKSHGEKSALLESPEGWTAVAVKAEGWWVPRSPVRCPKCIAKAKPSPPVPKQKGLF